jgi:NADPH2:quinone reductase
MRAIAISQYGSTPYVANLPEPTPAPGQVTISVKAAAMNPMDWKVANGSLRDSMPATFPFVLGADVAGSVESLGEGATKFAVGDRVFGQLLVPPLGSTGTYAEEVAVTEDAPLARMPAGLNYMIAATLPTAGCTALGIVESLEPLAGETVLIVGAGGGVGSFATQFAANSGALVLADTRMSDANRMQAYGAAETVDSRAAVANQVREKHPDGIDALIDVASDADAFAALAELVRPGGTALSTIGAANPRQLLTRGITGVNYVVEVSAEPLERVADAVVTGQIVAPPITEIGVDDAPEAVANMAHASGKTVITMHQAAA